MNDSDIARDLINKNLYAVIATSNNGEPWVSPVFFARDDMWRLYWVSNKDSLHSIYIRSNQNVAAVIFNSQAPEGDGDGVYVKGTAEELLDQAEIEKGIDIFNKKSVNDKFRIHTRSEVSGEGQWRIYRLTPIEITKLGEGKFINGQYTDQRIEVRLQELKPE